MGMQDNYNDRPAVATPGMIGDLVASDTISRIAEGNIGFGKAVVQGTSPRDAKIGAAGKFLGITVEDKTLLPEDGDVYKNNTAMAIQQKGSIWVVPVENVLAADPVYRYADGTLGKTATDGTLVDRAYWEIPGSANGLAMIRQR